MTAVLRPTAEQQYAAELAAVAAQDDRQRPPNWNLSPQAVKRLLSRARENLRAILEPYLERGERPAPQS